MGGEGTIIYPYNKIISLSKIYECTKCGQSGFLSGVNYRSQRLQVTNRTSLNSKKKLVN